MPDQRIPLLPGKYYHVYNHAVGSENLFRNDENYSYFLKQYAEQINDLADTFAYCLMPNHFHFFVRLKEVAAVEPLQGFKTLEGVNMVDLKGHPFSKKFSNLCNGYAQAYNKLFNRRGSLFIPRFKRKEVNSDEYRNNLIRYVHQNPVLHGFVKSTDEWIYSSYNSLVSLKPTNLCRSEVIDWYDNAENFRASQQEEIPQKFILEMEFR